MKEVESDMTCPTGFEALDRTLRYIRTLASELDPDHAEELADAVVERAIEFLAGRSEERRHLDIAFGFISSVIVPWSCADTKALADALVKRAIEMTGERA